MGEELYFLLKPSKISGVGVFTERSIKAGEYLRIWLVHDWKLARHPRGRLLKMCNHFGVRHGNCVFSRPKNFTRMSLAWYLNHSSKPNVRITKSGRAYAIRKISKGQELTIDYGRLDDEYDNDSDPAVREKHRRM